MQLLDCFDRGRWQALTDCIVNGSVRLHLAACAKVLSGVQDKAARTYVARGLPVEQVVGNYRVKGKAIARVALAIRPDGLVPQSFIGARTREKIRVHTRSQDGQLRKA